LRLCRQTDDRPDTRQYREAVRMDLRALGLDESGQPPEEGGLFLRTVRGGDMNEQERVEHRLNDHAGRIRELEAGFAAQTVIVQELCKKMDSLIAWIKALLIAWCTGMGAFSYGMYRI